jgi:hypothetical protein
MSTNIKVNDAINEIPNITNEDLNKYCINGFYTDSNGFKWNVMTNMCFNDMLNKNDKRINYGADFMDNSSKKSYFYEINFPKVFFHKSRDYCESIIVLNYDNGTIIFAHGHDIRTYAFKSKRPESLEKYIKDKYVYKDFKYYIERNTRTKNII